MADAAEFLQLIKRAAVDAVRAEKPAGICYGVVQGEAPLTVYVDQKLTLEEDQMVVPEHLKDRETEFSIEEETEEAGEEPHFHAFTGRKKMIVHDGLKAGEKVALLQADGGQIYIVLGRIT